MRLIAFGGALVVVLFATVVLATNVFRPPLAATRLTGVGVSIAGYRIPTRSSQASPAVNAAPVDGRGRSPEPRTKTVRAVAPGRAGGQDLGLGSFAESTWRAMRPRGAIEQARAALRPNRRTHLYAVARLIPSCSATWAAGQPASTRAIKSWRPKTVRRALGCATRVSRLAWCSTPQTVGRDSHLSQRLWGLHLGHCARHELRVSPRAEPYSLRSNSHCCVSMSSTMVRRCCATLAQVLCASAAVIRAAPSR